MDPSWIAAAFSAVNAVRVVFYVPQIVAVARSVDGARDIALSTWAMWALTNALGAAYGLWVARDAWLAASFALSWLACTTTLGLAIAKRRGRRAAARTTARTTASTTALRPNGQALVQAQVRAQVRAPARRA